MACEAEDRPPNFCVASRMSYRDPYACQRSDELPNDPQELSPDDAVNRPGGGQAAVGNSELHDLRSVPTSLECCDSNETRVSL